MDRPVFLSPYHSLLPPTKEEPSVNYPIHTFIPFFKIKVSYFYIHISTKSGEINLEM